MPAPTHDLTVDRLPDAAAPIEVMLLHDATFGAARAACASPIATTTTSCSGRAVEAGST